MAIFVGNSGEDILQSRATAAIKERIKGTMAEKLCLLPSGEDVLFVSAFADSLADELAWEDDFRGRFDAELATLTTLETTDYTAALRERLSTFGAEHFQRRASVLALHQICNSWRDSLIVRAVELSLAAGFTQEAPRFALLASGDVGRLEQSLLPEPVRFYLVHEGKGKKLQAAWEKVGQALEELLAELGLVRRGNGALLGGDFWVGPPDLFVETAGDTCLSGDERADFPFLPDLRCVAGDCEFAGVLTDKAVAIIRNNADFFARRAKRAATMPVATSFFGWYRVERTGEHRGEFDLEQYTLNPLLRNVCVLALKRGVRRSSTIDRIKGLLAGGWLSVDITEKLLAAYHQFMRQKVLKQLESFERGFNGYFLDPEYLSEEEEQRFRNGLEAVVNLQKLIYHQLVGQG